MSGSDDMQNSNEQISKGSFLKGTYFYSSFLATAIPGFLGKKMGITPDFHHWNFITDQLILGALPVLTKCCDSGDHLHVLQGQLRERNLVLGLVVAALESAEMSGFGLSVVEFAKEENWREINPSIEYRHVSFEDTSANVQLEDIALAVEHIYHVISDGKAVFVHCKAGKGRSWMIVMGYLTTYSGLTFAQADELVKSKRKQVNPSTEQKIFATEFPLKFEEWKRKKSTFE